MSASTACVFVPLEQPPGPVVETPPEDTFSLPEEPAAPPPAPAPAPGETARAGRMPPQLVEVAERALEEASRVAPGANDCETAYGRLAAILASIERDAPDSVRELPAQDRFLGVCSRLPEAMQRCLVVDHAIANEAACAAEADALDPALRAELEALMGAGG